MCSSNTTNLGHSWCCPSKALSRTKLARKSSSPTLPQLAAAASKFSHASNTGRKVTASFLGTWFFFTTLKITLISTSAKTSPTTLIMMKQKVWICLLPTGLNRPTAAVTQRLSLLGMSLMLVKISKNGRLSNIERKRSWYLRTFSFTVEMSSDSDIQKPEASLPSMVRAKSIIKFLRPMCEYTKGRMRLRRQRLISCLKLKCKKTPWTILALDCSGKMTKKVEAWFVQSICATSVLDAYSRSRMWLKEENYHIRLLCRIQENAR